MRKLLPFIFSCLIFNQIQGQFVDCYQESNWNIVENNTGPNTLEPGVTFNGTTSMTLIADGDFLGVSGNGAPAGIPFNCMVNDGIVMACTSIAGDGLVTFDWDYSMELYFENPANEPFGYCINSDDFVSLMAPNTWSDQSGSESIEAQTPNPKPQTPLIKLNKKV